MATAFDTIRQLERRETDRLGAHLAHLDADGLLEQSYCAEWRVYQVASHLASGARIYLGNLTHWFDGGPPVAQEDMQRIWADHDSLKPSQMPAAFREDTRDYFARLEALPSEAGTTEVDSFLGKQQLHYMLALRLQEVVLHSWDILVARHRSARLPADAVEVLLPLQLELRAWRMPAALAGKRVRLATPDGRWRWLLDCRGEKPAVEKDPAAGQEAEVSVEAPAEELCRLLTGRHFLPGSLPGLVWQGASYQEISSLNLFAP